MRHEKLILEVLWWLVSRQKDVEGDESFKHLRRIRTAMDEIDKDEAELQRIKRREHYV